ncbi:hypothetical protein AVEN_263729-1 [Araneus ventricosus]|uniref:HTH psq-type domain-containing protein n=1 Tax=Araneus ventricosus TaxID=182803 RepID=A0A4Y2AU55_ARAVE|nr:hypothetical protein AVEN_263729-1 [Araneus ventricosus]
MLKRVLGASKNLDYSPETPEACLKVVSKGECTLKDAEVVFGIPKRVICYERKQLPVRKPGRSMVFSNEEEKSVSSCIVQLNDFVFSIEFGE